MDLKHAPIVFLHIPKTAGQTIHNSLSRVVKARRVSPIRVHTQSANEQDQFPPGYSLYSGHLDWATMDHLPPSRFVFTVLRDPGERIASFYFYLQREAAGLSAHDLNLPQNIGLKRALQWSPDDYFFGGDDAWQTFVRSHYDNFYCTYFSTRRMLGWGATQSLASGDLLASARRGLASINRIFSTNTIADIEVDFLTRYGIQLHLADKYDNASAEPANLLRWPRLLANFEADLAARQMENFVEPDRQLTLGYL